MAVYFISRPLVGWKLGTFVLLQAFPLAAPDAHQAVVKSVNWPSRIKDYL